MLPLQSDVLIPHNYLDASLINPTLRLPYLSTAASHTLQRPLEALHDRSGRNRAFGRDTLTYVSYASKLCGLASSEY